MKHLHTAIQIRTKSEVEDFYEKILGFECQYDFKLESPLTAKIFGRHQDVQVFNIKRDDVVLELFVDPEIEVHEAYTHVCLKLNKRKEVIAKARKAGYEVIEVARNNGAVYFIKDYSGNMFEIK
ncbi:MAG TPA: VOC family protein [Bacteroidales bacterium]|nr:VOC family protein [Bacteroidales bacterium]